MRFNTINNANSTNVSDGSAVRATLEGDRRAFDILVHRYEGRLLQSMVQRTGCRSVAEDIVQDTFLNAFRFLSSFRGGSRFYTWLYQIAINLHRSLARRRSEVTTLLGSEDFPDVEDESQHEWPLRNAERVETRKWVMQAIERLPSKQRKILYLREIRGMKYEAIADELGICIGTVRSRLARARSSLREELTNYMSGELDEHSSDQNEEPKSPVFREQVMQR